MLHRKTSEHTDPEPLWAARLGEDLTRSQNRNVFFCRRHIIYCPQYHTLINYFFFPKKCWSRGLCQRSVSSVPWAVFFCWAGAQSGEEQRHPKWATKHYLWQTAAQSLLGCARLSALVDCSFSPAPQQPHTLPTQTPFQTLSGWQQIPLSSALWALQLCWRQCEVEQTSLVNLYLQGICFLK